MNVTVSDDEKRRILDDVAAEDRRQKSFGHAEGMRAIDAARMVFFRLDALGRESRTAKP